MITKVANRRKIEDVDNTVIASEKEKVRGESRTREALNRARFRDAANLRRGCLRNIIR